MIVGFDSYKHKYNFNNVTGVIHVGAHHGQEYEMYMQEFGQMPTHWFEPLSEAYSVLRENIGAKPQVRTYKCALGPSRSVSKIWKDSGNDGQSSSLMKPKDHLEQWPHIEFNQSEEVLVETLDSFRISDSNLIVIDAQGYELEVLKGSEETLKRMDHVFCEVNVTEIYEGCPSLDDLDAFLSERGFHLREKWWTKSNWGDCYWSR